MAELRLEDRDRGNWILFREDEPDELDRPGPRVVLLAGESDPDEKRLAAEVQRSDSLVCTGGGLRAAWSAGYVPDLVVGDLRKLPDWAHERLPKDALVDEREQEHNDLEKTLSQIFQRWGAGAEVSLIGGSSAGRRSDHSLANMGVLMAEPHRRIQWVDGEGRMTAIRTGKYEIDDFVGSTLSILPWSLHGTIVSAVGVHYPLDEERLYLGGRGISNQVGDEIATIEVHEGVALIWVGV